MNIKKPEILSPAGSYDSLVAAVRSGADAVYLGAKSFSARRNADNFSEDELRNAVTYLRVRGVKAYLALNIMVKESEIEDALRLVDYAVSVGIDALIISDLGLARLIHKIYPDLPLHASTQMTLNSPSGLKLLKALGFKRVVAPREFKREELEAFCGEAKALGIEVEAFVHGALCMCVSGQCLLSSVIGGRSGNRGLCAGPCRLPFSVDNGNGYDLSLKDLSLLSYTEELSEMGVVSFKIEGRMKRPEYIAAATAAFRNAVDKKPIEAELKNALADVFTRSGFTDGYYKGDINSNMFGIRTDIDAANSKTAFSYLHSLYRNERSSIKVDINIELKKDLPIKAEFFDGENRVIIKGERAEIAKQRQTDKQQIISAFSKLGGTPYLLGEITVAIDEGLFIGAAALNALRREAVELLSSKRAEVKPILKNELKENTVSLPQGKTLLYARFEEVEQIPEDLSGIDTVILPAFKSIPDTLKENIRYAVELPAIIDNEQALIKRLEAFKAKGFTAAFCKTLPAVSLAMAVGLYVIGGIGLNAANSTTLKVLDEIGVSEVCLSAEISLSAAKKMSLPVKAGLFAYGRLPLMLLKSCPLKNGRECKTCERKGIVTDRKGIKFKILCRGNHSELFNSTYLYMADKQDDLESFAFSLLYFTDEDRTLAQKVIKNYLFASPARGEFTRGLYYRNTL